MEVNDSSFNVDKGLLVSCVEFKAIIKNADSQTDYSTTKDFNTEIVVYNLTYHISNEQESLIINPTLIEIVSDQDLRSKTS